MFKFVAGFNFGKRSYTVIMGFIVAEQRAGIIKSAEVQTPTKADVILIFGKFTFARFSACFTASSTSFDLSPDLYRL